MKDFLTISNRLKVASSLHELHRILEWLRDRLFQTTLSTLEVMKIEIAVEEIAVNIMKHAYKGPLHFFEIEWLLSPPGYIQIRFKDQGKAFNPLLIKTKKVQAKNLDQIGIGGLGLFFTKMMMDEIQYLHRGNNNVLTLKKKLF